VFELNGYDKERNLCTCGTEIQNAWEPKDKLWRGTSSTGLGDEHVNLINLW